MDWRSHLEGLLQDTQRNLAKCPGNGVSALTTKTPPSFALLRQGVSPGDPHLIAPASDEGTDELISPFYPPIQTPPSLAAGQPNRPPMMTQAQQQQLAEVAVMQESVRTLTEQLEAVHRQAVGWQKVTANVASLDSRHVATDNQLSLLSEGMAGLEAAQARMQQASHNSQRDVQQQLASFKRRMEGLAVDKAARVLDEVLAPFSSRLQQAEQALDDLSGRLHSTRGEGQEEAGSLVDAGSWSAAVASLQEELQELRSSQGATAERQDAQALELAGVAKTLQVVQAAVSAAAQQHATQLGQFGSQHAEVNRIKSKAEVHAARVEQLAGQLADVSRRLDQQEQQQLADAAPRGADPAEVAALRKRLESYAAAVEQLQAQAVQVATVQEAVDEANQRLFELRVEALNAAEDSAIMGRSAKRQAEAAELRASEAADTAADVCKLAGRLGQEVEGLHQQMAALQRQSSSAASDAGGAGVAHTVAQVVGELAALKVTMAQQQEAAEAAEAAARAKDAAREEQVAGLQAALAALQRQLEQQGSQGPTVASLSSTIQLQGQELAAVKQACAQAQTAAAAAAASATAATEAVAAIPTVPTPARQLEAQDDAIATLEAGASHVRQQLAEVTAAVGRQDAERQQETSSIRLQLAELQEAWSAAAAAHADIMDLQRRLASIEGSNGGMRDCQQSIAALTKQVGQLEAELNEVRQSRQVDAVHPAPELQQEVDARVQRTEAAVALALEGVVGQMAAVVARLDRAEAVTMSSVTHAQAAAMAAQRQVDEVRRLVAAPSLHRAAAPLVQSHCAARDDNRAETLRSSLQQTATHPTPDAQQQQQLSCPAESVESATLGGSQSSVQPGQGQTLQTSDAQLGAKAGGSRSGNGLFARISRSFTNQRRKAEPAAGSAAPLRPAAEGPTCAAYGAVDSRAGSEVPLRVRYSSSLEQEHGVAAGQRRRTSSGLQSAPASASHSRRSTACASGTPPSSRQSGSAVPGSTASLSINNSPRSRSEASGAAAPDADAAALPQEPSGFSDAADMQVPAAAASESSFGAMPLPQDSSFLGSHREDLEERIAQLKAELEGEMLDDVQREVLLSDLRRLQEQAEQAP